MKFELDKSNWTTIEQGEKDCFLLTNGLGGYCSLTVTGGLARGDQALLMAAKKAPNVRRHLLSNVLETFSIDGREYVLTSQRMLQQPDLTGFQYLERFVYDRYPQWSYRIGDCLLTKRLIMVHGENSVALQYHIAMPSQHTCSLRLTPLLRFSYKKEPFCGQRLAIDALTDATYRIAGEQDTLYISSNARRQEEQTRLYPAMYFSQDERDGREKQGVTAYNHSLVYDWRDGGDMTVIFSTTQYEYNAGLFAQLMTQRMAYEDMLLAKAPLHSEIGRQLVLSADAYVVDRESTGGKSILAGYPFFEDWGRDTMIALAGTTMVTRRFAECKSILQTFARYERHGLLPNLFPEGDATPMYNSADAPLLFINAVYEYIEASGDIAFLDEVWEVLLRITDAYEQGTDFHIYMDADGLISAGDGLEQLTWMDVRVGDYLPTPRHGKPVEINAYWYNDLKVMEHFAGLQKDSRRAAHFQALAERVRDSFLHKFWNEQEHCLKDVLCGTDEENQVRCNQVWALTMPFTMLPKAKELAVLQKLRRELYTTAGLRTLAPTDAAFHDIYIGMMQERDRAYHQGTVWAFPLGAYYRAWIHCMQDKDYQTDKSDYNHVEKGIEALKAWLREGCIGQLAEIYDGGEPSVSRGCFAQAWSVAELLRAVRDWESFCGK